MFDARTRNKDNEHVRKAIDAAKKQIISIWLIVRIAGTFIAALTFGAILTNPTAKILFPSLESLMTELASPNIWSLQFVFAFTLALIVLTSPFFKHFASYVYLALVASCYTGAILFGIGLGDALGRGIRITSVDELNWFIFVFILKLLVATFLLLFIFISSQIISRESMEAGFLSIWWKTSRFTRYGAPVSTFLIGFLQWVYKGGII